MRKLSRILTMLLAVGLIGMMTACDNSTEPDESSVEALATHIDAMLADWGPTYSPDNLYTEVSADDAPYILSVRATTDYDDAHITGAENIPWTSVATQADLDAANVPMGETVVAYCYTGHTGQISATILKMMGYDATNLKFGMMSFYSDANNGGGAGGVAPFDYSTDPPNSGTDGIETASNSLPASDTYDLPDLDFAGGTPEEMAQSAANMWLGVDTPIISATALFDELNDGNSDDDPMIISVRSATHYDAGHITGAYNIPWRDIAKLENLTKLDPEAEYVVYCYTGHTGQVATTVLKTLGYNVKNLKYGMMGWTQNETYMGGVGTFDAQDVFNDPDVLTLGQ